MRARQRHTTAAARCNVTRRSVLDAFKKRRRQVTRGFKLHIHTHTPTSTHRSKVSRGERVNAMKRIKQSDINTSCGSRRTSDVEFTSNESTTTCTAAFASFITFNPRHSVAITSLPCTVRDENDNVNDYYEMQQNAHIQTSTRTQVHNGCGEVDNKRTKRRATYVQSHQQAMVTCDLHCACHCHRHLTRHRARRLREPCIAHTKHE